MPSHNWKQPGKCPRCGTTRRWDFSHEKHPIKILPGGEGALDRSLTNSPYLFGDGRGGWVPGRPVCPKAGPSRSARRNGRRRRVLAASRAGGARLVSREAKLRAERLARLLAEAVAADALAAATALPEATPALTPPEEADAF